MKSKTEELMEDEDLDGLFAMYAAAEKEETAKVLKRQIIGAILWEERKAP